MDNILAAPRFPPPPPLTPPAPPPSPLYPFELPTGVTAWYRPGEFSLTDGTWADASGNGNAATLSGSGFAALCANSPKTTNISIRTTPCWMRWPNS